MPVVPTVEKYDNPNVQAQVAPSVKAGSNPSLEAFGGGAVISQPMEAANKGFGEAQDIINQHIKNADDIAVTNADTQLGTLKNNIMFDPQNGYFKKQGKDALASLGDTQQSFTDGVDNISNTLSSRQQVMFRQKASTQAVDFNAQLQRHASQQSLAYDSQVTDASLANYGNQAVLNYQDPGQVNQAIENQKQVIMQHGQRNGMSDEAVQENIDKITSKTRTDVIQRMLANGDTETAQAYYDANKDKIAGMDAVGVEKSLHASQVLDTSLKTWDGLKNMTLADGKPDEAKMEASVMGRDDLNPEDKQKILAFVKAKASEQNANITKQREANERDFLNTVSGMKQDGTPVEEALKQVNQYAIDDYDRNQKTIAAMKIYAPKEQSDPQTFMKLWQNTQDGTASNQDIDQAMNSDKISVADWRSLREELYKGDTEGKSPQVKQAYDRIKLMAEDQYGGDKQKQAQFLYDIHQGAAGKAPDQIIQMAQDKMKLDDNSGKTWLFGIGRQEQWKTDLDKRDAQSTAWGKAYTDVGKSETLAIGQGMSMTQKTPFAPKDIDTFANQLGGYQAIKAGQPANNAIKSLMQKQKPVTPGNVKAVLEKYPDGIF